jgi:MoxR-like ATPase
MTQDPGRLTYRATRFVGLPADGVLKQQVGEDGKVVVQPYVFDDSIVIAVDVALATNRPLLVSGDPGCGKSRLADAVAELQGWSLIAKTMTSRTRLESLTAEVDQLRRLNDAQARDGHTRLRPDAFYLNPGIFWWAFDPESAKRRGITPATAAEQGAELSHPGQERRAKRTEDQGAVLLIDEIDKAEPDLPNDLLEPLDRRRFDLPAGFRARLAGDRDSECIEAPEGLSLLTVVTTNGERELPQAFLRRCVRLELNLPKDDDKRVAWLREIALQHFPDGDEDRIEAIAKRLIHFQKRAGELQRRLPGTAELLDAVRACEKLKIAVSDQPDSVWAQLERAVIAKDSELWAERG